MFPKNYIPPKDNNNWLEFHHKDTDFLCVVGRKYIYLKNINSGEVIQVKQDNTINLAFINHDYIKLYNLFIEKDKENIRKQLKEKLIK